MRLPDAIQLKVTQCEVSWLEREVGMTQRLLAEVIQAVLMVRDSAFAGVVRELPVQVEQTVLLMVERHRERPVVGANASCAVEANSPFRPPLVFRPWSA